MSYFNRTKIVATIGPASRSQTVLMAMASAGVDLFRLNGAYETPAAHRRTIKIIRHVEERHRAPIGILLDLPGPKHRLGMLLTPTAILKRGEVVSLACGKTRQTDARLPVPDVSIAHAVKPGHTIFIADGLIALRVLRVRGHDVECRVANGGEIKSGKGINLPRVPLAVGSLTTRDRELARLALAGGIDYVGLSFVRTAQNMKDLRRLLRRAPQVGLIAKIEKPEALDDLDNIIDVADAIMIARGDLGIEMPFDQVPLIQRHILERCQRAGKPAITATQMLTSMVTAARPTRAEAADVAQAVWQGTDAVMLSEETSVGVDPARAVRAMAHIAASAEQEMTHLPGPLPATSPRMRQAHALGRAAYEIAEELGARAVIAPTRTGHTPS